MREKVYEVVNIYDKTNPLYTFKHENIAQDFIKKYLYGNKNYVVQPREREEFTSLDEFDRVSQKRLAKKQHLTKSLYVVLDFDVKVRENFSPKKIGIEDGNFVVKRIFNFQTIKDLRFSTLDTKGTERLALIKINQKEYFLLNEEEYTKFAIAFNQTKNAYNNLLDEIEKLENLLKRKGDNDRNGLVENEEEME